MASQATSPILGIQRLKTTILPLFKARSRSKAVFTQEKSFADFITNDFLDSVFYRFSTSGDRGVFIIQFKELLIDCIGKLPELALHRFSPGCEVHPVVF